MKELCKLVFRERLPQRLKKLFDGLWINGAEKLEPIFPQ
jgi:hypothetical protein